jgi:hypothetical protein
MLRARLYRIALVLRALPLLQCSSTPDPAPTAIPMIHQSSMGPLEGDVQLVKP